MTDDVALLCLLVGPPLILFCALGIAIQALNDWHGRRAIRRALDPHIR